MVEITTGCNFKSLQWRSSASETRRHGRYRTELLISVNADINALNIEMIRAKNFLVKSSAVATLLRGSPF